MKPVNYRIVGTDVYLASDVGRSLLQDQDGAEVYLASEVDPLLTHKWVPLAECGELEPGEYWCRCIDGHSGWGERVVWNGEFWLTLVDPAHVLSPHMGPMPEVSES